MNPEMRGARALTSAPVIGAWVPTATLHVLFFVIAAAMCLLTLPPPLWLLTGLLLTVVVTLMPHRLPTWWLLLLLALSPLQRTPSGTDFVFYLLLAGVHLLHVLGGFTRVVPVIGRMQVGALVRPLQRFVLIQLFVQTMAASALLAFDESPGTIPGLSILAAGVLCVVAAILVRQLRQSQLLR